MSSPEPSRRQPRSGTRMRSNLPLAVGLWPIISGVLLIALIGSLVWNINLRNDVDHHKQEASVAREEAATLRQRANATVYQLLPVGDSPANANGQVWFSVQGSGVLSVANLPALADGRIYQLWYGTADSTGRIPGGTFTIDETGQGFMLIPADVGTISSIGISEEPAGGSQEPSGGMILESQVDGARG